MSGPHLTPGHLVEELLNDRGWSQRTLARVLDMHEATVGKILSGRLALSAAVALQLSEVFGVEAMQFLDLQKRLELEQAKLVVKPDAKRSRRAHLFGDLPVQKMVKRGWLVVRDERDSSDLEAALTKFFDAPSVDEIETLPHAAKRTDVLGGATPTQVAWLYRVRSIAREMLVPRYTEDGLRKALPKLQALLQSVESAALAPRILMEAGVRFALVESLPGAKIDGVCFWLDSDSPVVALTCRLDRVDNFWFVLRHELEHVLQRDGAGAALIDSDMESGDAALSEAERAANKSAAEFCVPQDMLKKFVARKDPYFAERDIVAFAKMLKVHPGMVAGQLQKLTGRYERFRTHQVKVRHLVAPSAVVDGWGDVAPIGE